MKAKASKAAVIEKVAEMAMQLGGKHSNPSTGAVGGVLPVWLTGVCLLMTSSLILALRQSLVLVEVLPGNG